jgi:hypothetical protein
MPSWPSKVREIADSNISKVGSHRRFGVELEISYAPDHGVLQTTSDFSAHRDGSVRGDGLELVSPILRGNKGLLAVTNLLKYAASKNWVADASCGFHLHIDMNDLSEEQKKKVLFAYVLTAELWHAFVSRTRHNNSYCGRPLRIASHEIEAKEFDTLCYSAGGGSRYCWLNLQAHSEHGTFEVRLHEGTIDSKKVTNWIKAHLRFVDAVIKMSFGEIREMFGETKTMSLKFRSMETVWRNRDISEHYRRTCRLNGAELHAI